MTQRRVGVWVAVLIGGVAGQWALDVYGERATDFWSGALLHGIATLGYVCLCRAVVAQAWRPRFWPAFAVAVTLRLLCLPLSPALSDDIYRYMHEGTMVVHGENPYLTAPAAAPDHLRHPDYWPRINNRDIPAAYPPAVQFALAAAVTLTPTPLGMKILFGCCDLLTFLVLWSWLPAIGARRGLAVIHGWCPLLALEFAGEGHSDSLAVLFVVLCLHACSVGRYHLGAGVLAVAVASKLMPVVLLPFVVRGRWLALVPFAAVIGLLYWPFVADVPVAEWPRLFDGAVQYASRWRGNDSVFHLIRAGVDQVQEVLAAAGIDLRWLEYYPHNVAKVPVVIFGTVLLILAWVRRWSLHKVAAAVFMLFVSMTPTMHPWYLAFLVPFLCLYPSTFWLVFTGTIFLAYHVRPEWIRVGTHLENLGIKVAEYVPFYLGFLSVLLDTRDSAATDRRSRERRG